MFHPEKLDNPPTTSKFGVRPNIFKVSLCSAVFVVGFLISQYHAEHREQKHILP
jgi:hypothetical protein